MRTPFTIFIDTAEILPFRFENIRGDSEHGYDLWEVQTARVALGRHPDSLGDYSISDGIGFCHVERKSREDGHSTLLGFGDGHRKRLERELLNLSKIESAAVVVECSFEDFVCSAPTWGTKSQAENAKNLFRSVLALSQDSRVPWIFAGDRATAEQVTFHWLRRWWEKDRARKRQAAKELKSKAQSSIPF